MYLYGVVGVKEGCNLTPFLLQVGLSVSLTHRLGQLPYPGPLPVLQRKRPQLKELFPPFLLFFPLLPSPSFFLEVVSDEMGPCVCFYYHGDVLILMKISTVDLILKNIAAVFCEHLSNKNRKTIIGLFSKGVQVCYNRCIETLKQAKSSISTLNTCWPCLGLHRGLQTAG